MQGNTLQSTDYQLVRQYICLHTVQGAPTPSVLVLIHSSNSLKI